ncbi:hypothetical protein B0H14DRAFT_3701557 [Mycena olivaceomarginata]|nr:hypothetical protein B0H14DRAFT_3701557 [Mycena olivaceomarginata]
MFYYTPSRLPVGPPGTPAGPPSTPAGPPRTPVPAHTRPNEAYEARFAAGIFDDVLNVTARSQGAPAPRPSRARFQWPARISVEDRLLVAFRCMQQAGFETVGDYFAAVLDPAHSKHQKVFRSVTAFLQCQGTDTTTHPISIVQRIFEDPRSKKHVTADNQLHLDLPRHALPPSQRLLPKLPEVPNNNTHNAFIDWALRVVLSRLKDEAEYLLHPFFGFTRERRRDEPAEKFSWSEVLNWSMTKNQEIIAVNAPAIFACLTSIVFSDDAQKKLVQAAGVAVTEPAMTEPQPTPELDPIPGGAPASQPNGPAAYEPEDEPLSNGVSLKMQRDPWLGVTAVILIMLYFRYRYAIVFPTFIGLFLFTCNAHRDIFALLCRVGFSVSYSTVLATLHVLAADSSTQLHAIGAAVQVAQPMFLLLFDNVNKMQRAWQQVLGKRDTLNSGCASTLIGLEDITEDAMDSGPLLKNIEEKKRKNLTVSELIDDIDWEHLEGVGSGTAAAIWTKHVPSLRMHAPAAPTTGVAMQLQNLVVDQLLILGHWLQCWLIMICGDQLSIDRIRNLRYIKIKMYMDKGDTPFQRHDWALPIIQLWHLKWNWQKAIFRLHWFEPTGKDIFGLHHDVDLLTRTKFNHLKCDFYPAHHILEDRFDALMLDALRWKKTGIIHPPKTPLIDGLEMYFNAKSKGPLKDITFEELDAFSHIVYRRCMCNDAFEDAQGHYPRDPTIHGPQTVVEDVPPLVSIPGVPSEDADSESETEADSTAPMTQAKKRKGTRAKKGKAAESANSFGNDQCHSTTINFIRMTFWYLEMCAAIAEGDIGRVFEVLKVLRFSFWGAGSTNYGNEMLELACNFLYDFPPALRHAVLNNYLVNTTGLLGHWLELDLLQEHFNFWIKRLFNSKSHNFDSKHLAEAVGLNIHGISFIRDRFPSIFGFRKNQGKHKNADTTNDLNALGFHYRDDRIMQYLPGRNGHILDGGKLDDFLERTTRNGASVQPENDSDISQDDEGRLTANPITSGAGGIMDLTQFNLGDS